MRPRWPHIVVLTLMLVTLLTVEGITVGSFRDTTSGPNLIDVDYEALQEVIESYKGEKVVLLNVWATWCGPCVEELPYLVKIQQTYPEKVKVVLLSADLKNDRKRVVPFLKEKGVTWTTYFKVGNNQRFLNQLSDRWSGALPYTKIIDEEGNVVTQWQGSADYKKFEHYIQKAMEDAYESN